MSMETRFIDGGEFVDKATYIETRDKLSRAMERIAQLEAKIDDPSWLDFMEICNNFLAHYPPDIFTGVSGDPGPLFVVALRAAIQEVETDE